MRPIKTPADLQGLKIRTMESPVYMEMVSALGANPTPIAGSEAVMALQQGVVDGLENPPPVLYTGGAADVAKYLTLNEHVLGLHIIIANKDWFGSLTPSQQAIVQEGARLMASVENVQKTEGDWIYASKIAEEKGVEVHTSTPEEKQAFKDAVYQPVRKYIAEQVGEELLTRMEASVGEAEKKLYGASN